MLARPSSGRIFVATQPTDLRKSYDGLSALVEGTFERDLTTGDMFVFINRRATQVRILYWDRDGFCIWMKRLEAGTFRRLEDELGHALLEVDAAELMMLLGGLEAKEVRRRKRYEHVHQDPTSSLHP